MESRPVEVYPVHDYLRSRLCSLYENDSIFDRFECGWNGNDSYPTRSLYMYIHVHVVYILECTTNVHLSALPHVHVHIVIVCV